MNNSDLPQYSEVSQIGIRSDTPTTDIKPKIIKNIQSITRAKSCFPSPDQICIINKKTSLRRSNAICGEFTIL